MFASNQLPLPSFVSDRLAAPFRGRRAARPLVLTLLAALLLVAPSVRAQNAGSVTVLHGFLGSDGAFPNAPLVQGGDGNFYGTTEAGGATGNGTVFRVTPAGVYTLLYSFTGGSDGAGPNGGLVQGSDGNFYGTTSGYSYLSEYGGDEPTNNGTVFKITSAGVLTTLYSFTGGDDGSDPDTGLVQGSDGNFYGTTEAGTIFRITPAGALTTLPATLDNRGSSSSALVQGSDGNFYGTTAEGGDNDFGSVFQVTPAGTLTTLYSFTGGNDGNNPSGLVQGRDGNFYGTTDGYVGGSDTIFQITPAGVLTTLYNFGTNGVTYPGGLVLGSDGNFYGTTYSGGADGDGVVFQFTPAGAFTTVFAFNGGNGARPGGPLLQASDGSFYGVAGDGGADDEGTIFRLTLSASGAPGAGSLSLAAASTTTVENAGSVTLPVNRLAGNTGAVSVDYATADGSAVAGVDYQAVSGTLTWADGDSSPKYITVPLIDRGLASGSTFFAVNLGNPGGGAVLGSPVQEAVTVLDTEGTVSNIQSVSLLSPPAGIAFTQNQPVMLLADVEALANTLAGAEFFATDAAGNSTDLGGFTGETGQTTWQPAVPGSYTLAVVATDVQGNTQRAEISVNVVAASSVPATPQATLEGGLEGTTLALNDTVDVVAQAVDSQGNALQNAQFYLDGVPITTTPVSSDGTMLRRASVKAAAVSAGNGTSLYYKASVPVSKPRQSLTAVGTTASGVSAVSNAATVYGKINAGTPPAAAISNFNNGDSVTAGSAGQSVTVSASAGSLPIDHVELFVDDMSVGVATAAPYTFVLPAIKQGTHSLSAKATDTSLLSKVSEPVIVAAIVPAHPAFFTGEASLNNGVYYLAFPDDNYFGYYSYLTDSHYIYHFDLGYEYVFDAQDGKEGVYFYDFASSDFFYTSPSFPFPYLYDFGLNSVVYYYPDPNNPGHYNTNGYRFFYVFSTGQIITK